MEKIKEKLKKVCAGNSHVCFKKGRVILLHLRIWFIYILIIDAFQTPTCSWSIEVLDKLWRRRCTDSAIWTCYGRRTMYKCILFILFMSLFSKIKYMYNVFLNRRTTCMDFINVGIWITVSDSSVKSHSKYSHSKLKPPCSKTVASRARHKSTTQW